MDTEAISQTADRGRLTVPNLADSDTDPTAEVQADEAIAAERPTFGEFVRRLRDVRGLTQTALASRIGRSTSLLSLLESGDRRPTREILGELIRALQLSENVASRLRETAGFGVEEVDALLERVVQVLTAGIDCDDDDRALMRADVGTVVKGWYRLFQAAQLIHRGQFETAQDELDQLDAHREHTPTLRAAIHLSQVEVISQLSMLQDAETRMQVVQRELKELDAVPNWAPTLRAETYSVESMLALRRGHYQLAKLLINRAIGFYERLLNGSRDDRRIASLGLGKSYKRLAQVALFQGEPAEALKFCATAEAYLIASGSSANRDRWLRRTRELHAWALAVLADGENSDDARDLRLRIRSDCKDAGDDYGLINNSLYLAEDCRRRLKAFLQQANVNDIRDAAVRRNMVRTVLEEPQARALLGEAEGYYREALHGLQEQRRRILLGRCLRGLAIILRYKGTRDESSADYKEASELLKQSLTVEMGARQGRRIPSIYEAVAELEWDRGDLKSAVSNYQLALRHVDDPEIAASDSASNALRMRTRRALEVLHNSPATGSATATSDTWQTLCRRLVEQVHAYIDWKHITPRATQDRDLVWLSDLAALDEAPNPGRRLLAQNRLSPSLSVRLPEGFKQEAAPAVEARSRAIERQIRDAQSVTVQDLCSRSEVQFAAFTEAIARDHAENALRYLREYPRGYLLDTSPYDLPLAFLVRGDTVMIEVPRDVIPRFIRAGDLADRLAAKLCFAVHDEHFARNMTEIFDELVAEARRGASPPVEQWLAEVVLKHTLVASASSL